MQTVDSLDAVCSSGLSGCCDAGSSQADLAIVRIHGHRQIYAVGHTRCCHVCLGLQMLMFDMAVQSREAEGNQQGQTVEV